MDLILDSTAGLVIVATIATSVLLLLLSGAPFVWIRAQIARCPVSLMAILAMRSRGVPAGRIVNAYILCKNEGIIYPLENLEILYFTAPGNFTAQITSMVKARREEN